MWDDAQVSERWATDERKGGVVITPRLPFHYQYFLYQAWQETFLRHFRRISLSNELDEEYIETSTYTACIGAADPKVFQMLLFFEWFFLWVSQSFLSLNIRHRNCVIYGYFFCVYWSEMLFAHLHVPPVHECRYMYARYVYVNPDVKSFKKVSKIVFYEISIMGSLTTKTEFTRLWY